MVPILFAGATGFAIAAALTLAVGFPPPPSVHDEFSYLLSADTFVRGRLRNPTHPLWPHFESFHIIQQPSYASKYPPGQGLMLALGQWATGEPIVGVWLGYALMAASVGWALQAVLPVRWVLWGGVLAAAWFAGIHVDRGYWAVSYWGGAVAATGGALVAGGLTRLLRREPGGALSGLAFAVGLAVLANTRPFEGLLASLLPVAAFGVWSWRRWRQGHRDHVVRVLVPVIGTLMVASMMMGWYNARVTGSAFTFPYSEHERQYRSSPMLFGLPSPPAIAYRHNELACFYRAAPGGYVETPRSVGEYVGGLPTRLRPAVLAFLPLFVVPLLVTVPLLRRQPFFLPAIGSLVPVALGLLVIPWPISAHYLAPLVGWYLLVVTAAARLLARVQIRGRRVGSLVVKLVMISALAMCAVSGAVRWAARSERATMWSWQRQQIQSALESSGERHLVVVSYALGHSPHDEWVYNGADIDGAPVVWARSMGALDGRLYRYFADRKIWRLHVESDTGPFRLEPVAETELAAHLEESSGAAATPVPTFTECRLP